MFIAGTMEEERRHSSTLLVLYSTSTVERLHLSDLKSSESVIALGQLDLGTTRVFRTCPFSKHP